MRADRGYFCFPEIDLALRFRPGMLALIQSRLTPAVYRDALLSGARFGGTEAQARGIVDEAVALDGLLPSAIRQASAAAGKDRDTMHRLKRSMYEQAFELLNAG